MRQGPPPAASPRPRAWLAALLLGLVVTSAGASPPADPVLPPPSTLRLPPELLTARKELESIVARRDLDALLAHVRPETLWCFGGHAGLEGFQEEWNSEPAELQRFWQEMDAVLALPSGPHTEANEGGYCAPYTFCAPYPGDIDVFDALIVTGTDVAIRERPSPDARILTSVTHAVLTMVHPQDASDPHPRWAQVRLASGVLGYVSSDDVRSPVDFRLVASHDDDSGTWWLRYFLAGD